MSSTGKKSDQFLPAKPTEIDRHYKLGIERRRAQVLRAEINI